MILVNSLTYSQRIRVIGNDTIVTFTKSQAQAITDTFVSQRHTINRMKIQDSLNIENLKYYKDSLQRIQSKPAPKAEIGWEGWLFITIEGIIFVLLVTYGR